MTIYNVAMVVSKSTRMSDLPFHHSILGNVSIMQLLRHEFSDEDWAAFQVAHRSAYSQLEEFHFVYDICQIKPSQCSHIWPFVRYLTTEMKEKSEKQVRTVFILHNHNAFIVSGIQRMINWSNNVLRIQFVNSMDEVWSSVS